MATLTDSAADPIADHALIEEEVSIAKTIHACVSVVCMVSTAGCLHDTLYYCYYVD